jgi:hypothetical protein
VSSAKPQTGQLCAIRAESIVDEIRRYSFNLSFAVSAIAGLGAPSVNMPSVGSRKRFRLPQSDLDGRVVFAGTLPRTDLIRKNI